MALVRRITITGHPVPTQPGARTVPTAPSLPATATLADPAPSDPAPADPAPSDPPRADFAPSAPTARASVVDGDDPGTDSGEAAAWVPSLPASGRTVLFSFGLVAVGAAIGWAVHRFGRHLDPFQIGGQVSVYAGLLVFSGAVERVLEPFTGWLPGASSRNAYESAVAGLSNGYPGMSLTRVAEAKARLDRSTANRTVLMWALATTVATVLSAASGFLLLRMIAAPDYQAAIPVWVDALVTGLVVGTLSKPLHDLLVKARGAAGKPKD